MSLDTMTDTEIVALIKTFEPHDEGGQPMISMHFDLWKRVLALGAIPMHAGDWSKVEPTQQRCERQEPHEAHRYREYAHPNRLRYSCPGVPAPRSS